MSYVSFRQESGDCLCIAITRRHGASFEVRFDRVPLQPAALSTPFHVSARAKILEPGRQVGRLMRESCGLSSSGCSHVCCYTLFG